VSGFGGTGVLLVSQVLGAANLALWLEVRFGGRRKRAGRVLIGHLVASFALLNVMPYLVESLAESGSARAAIVLFGLLLPALVYTFLASLWLLTYLRDMLVARRS
jgi:hypothetical protein